MRGEGIIVVVVAIDNLSSLWIRGRGNLWWLSTEIVAPFRRAALKAKYVSTDVSKAYHHKQIRDSRYEGEIQLQVLRMQRQMVMVVRGE